MKLLLQNSNNYFKILLIITNANHSQMIDEYAKYLPINLPYFEKFYNSSSLLSTFGGKNTGPSDSTISSRGGV